MIARETWDDGGWSFGFDAGPIESDGSPCAGAYARSPAAHEVARARAWFEKGQLSALYPDGIPAPLVEALDLDAAIHAEWVRAGKPT